MDIDPTYAEALFSEPSAEQNGPPAHPRVVDQLEQEDIYRGEPPSPPHSPPPRPPSVSSASSSSSGWSGLGLRRGALGAVLELAINRWARASSGSSTSSGSSISSVHTQLPRRRRRRSSTNATTLNARSESIIRARRKARDECRILQREFTLFLPAALIPQAPHPLSLQGPPVPSQLSYDKRRILRTPSLPLVLAQLDSAIKRSAKLRRHAVSPGRGPEPWISESLSTASQLNTLNPDKGKAREEPRMPKSQLRVGAEPSRRQQAWWLDVSSPTWSDLREIGKVLHLHPLTLEDILHRDPREKLELFSRLGYYFIVFRALESEHTRSGACDGQDIKATDDVLPFRGNAISGTNVYIVVFRDGICSFHFEDMADHAERVRNKILNLEETIHMSSDWIAHGILDSIVDDFFPILHSIEQEIKDLDDLLLSDGQPTKKRLTQSQAGPLVSSPDTLKKNMDLPTVEDKEKTYSSGSENTLMPKKSINRSGAFSLLTSFRQSCALLDASYLKQWIPFSSQSLQLPPSPSPLIRMASSRRLVTSLARLLGTKSEVVSQIRKRLTNGTSVGPKSGPFEQAIAVEVGIYFGDIQDHILTLQHSLAHYERMLSHSHPAYLSHLRVSLSKSKGGMDKALVTLYVISVAVLAMQLVTGMFSTNLGNIPHNTRPSDDGTPQPTAPFNVFGAVLASAVLVGVGIIWLARYWWLLAKRKYARRSRF